MSAGRPGVLAFDPSVAGVASATGETSGGGGSLGTGTFYSSPTTMTGQGWSDVTDVIAVEGDLAGTMTAEVSNASDEEVKLGEDDWQTDTSITFAAIAGSTAAIVVDTAALKFIPAPSGSTYTARVATVTRLPTCVAAGSQVGKTLTMSATGILTIDGVAVVANDVVLVKNQANPVDNGVYDVTTAGAVGVAAILTRKTTLDVTAEAVPGRTVAVTAGTVNTGLHFVLTGPRVVTIAKAPRFGFGRYRLKFVQSGGLGSIKDRRVIKAS